MGKIDLSLLETIRRKGCVVIRNVVDDAEATAWKNDLRDYVKTNPVNGALKPLRLLFAV